MSHPTLSRKRPRTDPSSSTGNRVSKSTSKTKSPDASPEEKLRARIKKILRWLPTDFKLVHRTTNKEISLDNGEEVDWSDDDVEDLRADFIPRPLQKRAKQGTHAVWAIELCVNGVLSNINSIIIYPEGYDKPYTIRVGRASAQGLNRFWEARFTRPVFDSYDGEVHFRPLTKPDPENKNRKLQHFGTIVCFNDDLKLNEKTKFDLCVDKDDWKYRLSPFIYRRDFIGSLPTRPNGTTIDLALGVGRDWYELPLDDPSGVEKVKLVGHRHTGFTNAGLTVDANSININANLKVDLRTFHRHELIYDPVMTCGGYHGPGQRSATDRGSGGSGGDSGNDGNDGNDDGALPDISDAENSDDDNEDGGDRPFPRRSVLIGGQLMRV
jgi:hypothetical protein